MPLHSGFSWFCGDDSKSLVPPFLLVYLLFRAAQAYVDVLWSISKQTLSLYHFSRTPSSFSQLVTVFKHVSNGCFLFLALYLFFCCFSPGKLARAEHQLTENIKECLCFGERQETCQDYLKAGLQLSSISFCLCHKYVEESEGQRLWIEILYGQVSRES